MTIEPSHVRVILRGSSLNDELTKGPYASPDWVEGHRLSTLDNMTRQAVEPQLKSDRALPLALKELPTRRIEVRRSPVVTLALIGDYEDILTALSQDNLRQAFWKQDVETMGSEVARNPERAIAVKTSSSIAFAADVPKYCSVSSAATARVSWPKEVPKNSSNALWKAAIGTFVPFAIVNLQAITGNYSGELQPKRVGRAAIEHRS